MKKIVAIIRQEKYQDVKNALSAVGCEGMNISLQQFYSSAIFGKYTESQNELENIFISLEPENKEFLMKMAVELKEMQDKKK